VKHNLLLHIELYSVMHKLPSIIDQLSLCHF